MKHNAPYKGIRKRQLREMLAFSHEQNARLDAENTDLAIQILDLTDKTKRANRKKLTETQVYEIRVKHRWNGAKQKELAAQYGVNPATISRIVRGQYHRR